MVEGVGHGPKVQARRAIPSHGPMDLAEERARCPLCDNHNSGVIGRLGLRLVFRCEQCRSASTVPPQPCGSG